MATYKRNKSGGSQSEGASNSASPASSVALSNPSSSQGINNNAPKYGTLVPNRIFVGGISSNTTEAELCQLFSKYGNVKATKIIADRAGVSKGYGFVTFESEEEVKILIQDANNIVLKERRLNIAPAIKKQPFSRSFDTSSPPPTTPNLYFHNGVPYTFHNGMAFFPPTAHQPALTALPPPADPSIYPSYGQTQNPAPAPYGTPLLVPAPAPMFMHQNYSYQPLPMTNGAATQYMYAGSGSSCSNSSPGSPLAGTPDSPHPHLPAPFYTQQFTPQEAFFSPPVYLHYSYNSSFNSTEYELQDQQTANDDCSSTLSTHGSDISDRSSNRSPANSIPGHYSQLRMLNDNDNTHSSVDGSINKEQNNHASPTNSDSLVPVVSWKNHAEERELFIRDGRRAFYPVPQQPPPPPQMLMFPPSYPSPGTMFHQPKPNMMSEHRSRNFRQSYRVRSTRHVVSASSVPFIPKFPASFNNNNPLVMNNNFNDKKMADVSNGRPQRLTNGRGRGGSSRGSSYASPPPKPKPSDSFVSSPSPQMMQPQQQHFDRSVIVANSTPRWASNPPVAPHPMKRITCSKRQNGSTQTLGGPNNRMTKKLYSSPEEMDADIGGSGDAQPMTLAPQTNSEISSNMQSLSLGTSS